MCNVCRTRGGRGGGPISFAFWKDDSGCVLEAGRGEAGGECGNLLGMQPGRLEEDGASGLEQWQWVSRSEEEEREALETSRGRPRVESRRR